MTPEPTVATPPAAPSPPPPAYRYVGRPRLLRLLGFLTVLLGLWYLVFGLGAGTLHLAQVVIASGIHGPIDVYMGPALIMLTAFVVMVWSFKTAGALRRAIRWSRFSAVALALFALPAGFPYDLVAALAVVAMLFLLPPVRKYFAFSGR